MLFVLKINRMKRLVRFIQTWAHQELMFGPYDIPVIHK